LFARNAAKDNKIYVENFIKMILPPDYIIEEKEEFNKNME